MGKLKEKLAECCLMYKIDRFSPDEMIELLKDGEEVEWIVEQVISGGATGSPVANRLMQILNEISLAVVPSDEITTEDTIASLKISNDTLSSAPTGAALESLDLSEEKTPSLDVIKDLELPSGIDREQVEQLLSSPRGALMADFGVYCQEKGFSQEEATQMGTDAVDGALSTLHEEWLVTPREGLDGARPMDLLEGGRLFGQKVETYRREIPKLGRNDPCSCGSGRKYKKCCGKGE